MILSRRNYMISIDKYLNSIMTLEVSCYETQRYIRNLEHDLINTFPTCGTIQIGKIDTIKCITLCVL